MQWLKKLIKYIFVKSFQYLWTSLTLFNLLKERIQYGNQYFVKKNHPKPKCLEGWNSNYIQLSQVRLHYVQTGNDDKPLMLMIHGFPEFWYSYRYQLKHFENQYRCIAVDQRGYNLSDKPSGIANYHISLLANDVREIVEKLGYKSAVIVGHDWGAAVAWATATLFPEVVSKLVILNVPHPDSMVSGGFSQLLKSWYIFMFQSPTIPELAVSAGDLKMLSLMFRGKKGGLRNKENITDEDIEAWKHVFGEDGALTPPINYYRAIVQYGGLPKTASTVQPTTLIIWGTEDAFLGKELATNSVKFCRDCKVHFIAGASHWVQQDSPKEVNEVMEQFLTDHNQPDEQPDSLKNKI